MADERMVTIMERMFTSPSSLTLKKRRNARYRLKMKIKTKIDYIMSIMEIEDEEMRKFIIAELARLDVSPKNGPDSDTAGSQDSSFEDDLWAGRADL